MATVLFKRGDSATMDDTPIRDGLLFFNEETHKIMMDNGNERLQYGGTIDLISDVDEATSDNVYSASATNNLFPQKSTVVDSKANALAVTQQHIPLGCLAFKEALGTDDYSNVGDGTISGGLVALRGETLSATLAVGATTLVFNSTTMTANSYVDIYTSDPKTQPSEVAFNDSAKQIIITFKGDHEASVRIRVIIRNM